MIIIGIDPGIGSTGYGILEISPAKNKNKLKAKCLTFGLISTTLKENFPQRLKRLYFEINKLIKQYRPGVLVIENVFFFKNLKTFIPVSRAEGAIILAAARNKVPVLEVTPLQVKLEVAGYGRSEKKEVETAIKKLLRIKEIPRPDDIADALGVALCGAIKLAKCKDIKELKNFYR